MNSIGWMMPLQPTIHKKYGIPLDKKVFVYGGSLRCGHDLFGSPVHYTELSQPLVRLYAGKASSVEYDGAKYGYRRGDC